MDSIAIEKACRFCPRCGHQAEVDGCVPFRCSNCGFANFYGPVAAVGGLVINEQRELLLVRRAREPGKGKWGLPGGFVDRDETIEQALSREVLEETNLRVSHARYLTSFPNLYEYGGVVVRRHQPFISSTSDVAQQTLQNNVDVQFLDRNLKCNHCDRKCCCRGCMAKHWFCKG